MLSKQAFYYGNYGFILVSLIIQHFGITALHLLPIPTICSPYRYMFISSWDYAECMQTLPYQKMIIFTIISLSAVTTDNGRISAILVMIGLKSTLSCLVGARLILIEHMICCNTSAPKDNFAYFLLAASSLSLSIIL